MLANEINGFAVLKCHTMLGLLVVDRSFRSVHLVGRDIGYTCRVSLLNLQQNGVSLRSELNVIRKAFSTILYTLFNYVFFIFEKIKY